MTMDYVFSVDTIARYLFHLKPDISPLKLQKSLYFLFAYHGATYGQDSGEGVFEGSNGTPKYLFDANFEAWQYGPVIKEVYHKDSQNEYVNQELMKKAVTEVEQEPELKKFIDEFFEQIDSVSDFKLVDRSHQDESWKLAYSKGKSTPMDNDMIIEEYVRRYVVEE